MSKKIAIFLPDLTIGGAERVAVNLANEFIERGVSVDLVLLTAQGEFLSEVDPRVRIINLNASRIRNSTIPLMKYMRDERPAAMVANMWPLTGIALIARMLSRQTLKVMVVEHINWTLSLKSYSQTYNLLLKFGMKMLFPKADSIVAVSRGAADDLARICSLDRSRITTIYNPIVRTNDAILGKIEDSIWSLGEHKKIVAIGTFKEQKNFPLLLNSFAILSRSIDAKLLILGDGDDAGENRLGLENLVNQLDLNGKVLLPGFVINPLIYLKKADLFVLSSDFEGFGNVLVEALQTGTPIVSTDCPSGPREILEDGKYGILTPVGDAEALASAMLLSLTSSHHKETLIARAQDFSIAKATDQYLDLLIPGWRVQAPGPTQ